MVPHLTAKKAPISLVSCTRVLGLQASFPATACCGLAPCVVATLKRLFGQHCTLVSHIPKRRRRAHRARATIGSFRFALRPVGLRWLITSAARACGAHGIGCFRLYLRHFRALWPIRSTARACGAHMIGLFRMDMWHFGMVWPLRSAARA